MPRRSSATIIAAADDDDDALLEGVVKRMALLLTAVRASTSVAKLQGLRIGQLEAAAASTAQAWTSTAAQPAQEAAKTAQPAAPRQAASAAAPGQPKPVSGSSPETAVDPDNADLAVIETELASVAAFLSERRALIAAGPDAADSDAVAAWPKEKERLGQEMRKRAAEGSRLYSAKRCVDATRLHSTRLHSTRLALAPPSAPLRRLAPPPLVSARSDLTCLDFDMAGDGLLA